MVKRKLVSKGSGERADTPTTRPEIIPASAKDVDFPLARYISIVGVHTTLVSFAAVFLPQTAASWSKGGTELSTQTKSRLSLKALTDDPLLALVSICAGLVLIQGWWGGWIREWSLATILTGSEDEQRMERKKRDQDKLIRARDAWLATLLSSLAIHVCLILFGAPMTSHVMHTYLLACLISVLLVFTPVYTLGAPYPGSDTAYLVRRLTWVRLFAEFSIRNPIERAIVYPVVGTVAGCWVGAIPLPLDWDRPWQAWPLTCAFGAIAGYIVGSLAAVTISGITFSANLHRQAMKSI